jgi:arsenite-transporting ATPase
MRIIFFAGKGGVGKTSVAAATGIRVAEMGLRTIIMSLDVAHSLADIFDLERDLLDQNKGRPIKVSDNLWIQELDIQQEIEKNWGEIHKYLSALFKTTGLDEILAEELAILPGINRYVRNKEFDVILLDCAPTGESIRFISVPTTLDWYIKKIFKMEKTLAKVVGPVAKRIYNVPIPGDEYFDAIEHLFERLKGVDLLMIDPEVTSVRLIANPEKIVIKETQRASMYFSLYRMNIDAIIMNRVLPPKIKDAYFQTWRENQKQYMEIAKDYFSPIPIFPVNLFRNEVLGYERLKSLAAQIYGQRNPLEKFYIGQPYELSKEDGVYCLKLKIPFASKGDLELNKVSDELIVRIGSFKKHILLPRHVAASKSVRAKMEEEYLNVCFEGEDHG